MKAAVYERYGSPDVITVRDVAMPEPKDDELLIRVQATTVSRTDCGMLHGRPAIFVRPGAGLFRPKRKILGMDFAGIVEAGGSRVVSFKPGDRVFGLSPNQFGAHAEYLCVPETGPIARMPDDIDFDQAVVCEGAWYASTYIDAFGLKGGERILIYGASGAIGIAAVQLAKFHGAEVTAVVATRHLALMESLGADRVIDYTHEDFTAIGETYNFVLDAVGKTTFFRCRKLLKPGGTFSATDLGPLWQNIALSGWSSITRGSRVVFPLPKASESAVTFLRNRMAAGEFRSVIDRRYSLDEIVDAYRYVETQQKTGIVVISDPSASHE